MALLYLVGEGAKINVNPSFNWELEVPIWNSEEGMERSLKSCCFESPGASLV